MSSIKLKGSVSGEAIITAASDASAIILDKNLDLNGQELVLDADADTSIHSNTDDQIDFKTGGTDRMVIDSSGRITTPSQPAFSVVPTSDQDNCTGNGTNATVAFGTEIFDKNNDFASNTFTAPVTGSYFLTASVSVHDHTVSNTTGRMNIVTSNRSYLYEFDPAENISGAGVGSFSISVLADMDAGDTSTVTMQMYDSTLTVDIQTSGTFFQGYLMG